MPESKDKNNKQSNVEKVKFERKYRLSNVMIGLIVAIVLIIGDLWVFVTYDLSLNQNLLIILVSLVMYIILLFVLMRTNYKRVIVVNRKSKNDVIKALVKEVEGKEKAEKKLLDMIKPTLVGSIETKVYHDINCIQARKIKPKFRLENNSESFFKSKNFKAHNCIKKK